jgi:RNA polymerase sigma factor (sigma-70 family)
VDYGDFNDLRQDVVLRLDRCNVLERFDPEKASLNTYLTVLIHGYSLSWFAMRTDSRHQWKPFPTQVRRYVNIDNTDENGNEYHFKRIHFKFLNGQGLPTGLSADKVCKAGEVEPVEFIPEDLRSADNVGDRLEAKEILALLRDSLNEEERKVLDLLSLEFTQAKIAKVFQASMTMVTQRIGSIRAKGRKRFGL